jgi:hypothetical protein
MAKRDIVVPHRFRHWHLKQKKITLVSTGILGFKGQMIKLKIC